MQGCGKMATTLVSDAAMCEGRHCLRIKPHPVSSCCCCCFFFFSFPDLLRLTLIRLRHVPIRAELGWFRLNRPNINVFQLEKGNRLVRKKKKKLKPKIPVDWTGYWYAAVAGGLKSYLCFFVFFFASSSWVSTDYWVVLFYFFFLEEFCNFCFTFW